MRTHPTSTKLINKAVSTVSFNSDLNSATVSSRAVTLSGIHAYAGFSGIDTFQYQICDEDDLCDTATVTINVIGCEPCEPCEPCEGGVTSLALKYNGIQQANIEVKTKKGIVFSGTVDLGGDFSFNGLDKGGKLGKEIKLYVNGVEAAKIHTSCSKPIGIGLIAGDFEVLGGQSIKGGWLCPIPGGDPGGDIPEGECEGGVTSLTLKYNGAGPANIEVKTSKGIVYSGSVNTGQAFSFNGLDKGGKLGKEIKLYVSGVLAAKVHTSCSKPIGIGLVVGDFEVIEGQSLKGGALPPIP
ncbi:Ig-like domain-containing protein [Chloroflexota bacterium]